MPIPDVVGTQATRHYISTGVNKMADLLAATLGPNSGYIVHTRPNDELEVLDDAAIIARRVLGLQNNRENIGAMMVRHLVWRVGSETGDGGATAAILMRAIYCDALRLLVAGYHPTPLVQGIEKATHVVIQALRDMARPVTNENQLVALAQSVIRDDDLAAIIGEMRYLLGADGNVIIRDYTGRVLRRRYIAGTHVAAKALSRNFFKSTGQQDASLKKVAIAISDTRLWEADEAVNLMQVALQRGAESLLIITQQISDEVIGILTANHRSDDVKLKIFAVQIAEEGEHHQATEQDLCLLTGATLLGKMQEHSAANASPDDLGFVPHCSYEDEMLTILTGKNASPKLEMAIGEVRKHIQNLEPHDDEKRDYLVKRLARLTGGVGELKLGALTKHERKMRRHQAERALKALAVAQSGGVVAGGGAAYIHARQAIANCNLPDADVKAGYDVVHRALAAPMTQLLDNANHEAAGFIIDQIQNSNPSHAYDVLHQNFVDAYDDSLLDPVDVLIAALRKASSMAIRALMTDAIVFHRNPQMEGVEP